MDTKATGTTSTTTSGATTSGASTDTTKTTVTTPSANTPSSSTPTPVAATVTASVTPSTDETDKPKGPSLVYLYVIISAIGAFYLIKPTPLAGDSSAGTLTIEVVLWLAFVSIILLIGIARIFDIDVVQMLKNLITKPVPPILEQPPQVDQTLPTPPPALLARDQVFHVSDNKYNYSDAKAVCQAVGARIATFKEVDKAYEEGANWCSYGWSDGQMGLFPIQDSYYQTLQGIEGHEHDCGRPGINGGYFPDPNLQFGVNCYGKKPEITKQAAKAMEDKSPIPVKTAKERAFDERVDFWKTQVDKLTIAPFNQNEWAYLS